MGEFGNKFRSAREKKELSLDDVSNVTKISSRMLQAIEQEHFDQLPGGVFNKGFIRAYARHLGLDPEEAVSDYLATLRQAQIDAHEVWEPQPPAPVRTAGKNRVQTTESKKLEPKKLEPQKSEPKKPEPKRPEPKPQAPVQVEELPELQLPRLEDVRPPRKDFIFGGDSGILRILVASGIVVIALAAFVWTRRSRAPMTPPSPTQAAAQPVAPTPQPTAASPAASSSLTSTAQGNNSPIPASKPTSAQASPVTPTHVGSAAAKSETVSKNIGSDVTVRTFGDSSLKSVPKSTAAATLSLVIRANESSWISVQADGQPVTEETLIAPAHHSVHASREIVVRVGNAAGVSFIFNGKDLPAQGNQAEVKTFVFDSDGMKTSQ